MMQPLQSTPSPSEVGPTTPTNEVAPENAVSPGAANDTAPDAFAPANPTDNRKLYDFASRWPPEASQKQRQEGLLLLAYGVIGLGGLFAMLIYTPVIQNPQTVTAMALVLCTGLLGGTTFSLKWWYHSIARGIWNIDRFFWRVAVPLQAALVAMFMHILFKSELVGLLNPTALDKIHNTLVFGFLVGYFSDSAIAKLAEISESLFGAARGGRNKSNR